MTKAIESRLKAGIAASARNRHAAYKRFVESDDGRLILSELTRGSGILDIDMDTTTEDSIRIVSRWWPVASILNGAAMTDEQIIEWAGAAARARATELEKASQMAESLLNQMER